MHSLRKLSVFFNRTLRNNVRRTLTSQPAANANVDKDKGMYSKYHEKYVQADVRFANVFHFVFHFRKNDIGETDGQSDYNWY